MVRRYGAGHKRVFEVLPRPANLHGAPLFMRSDNGPEFVSQAILE